VTAPPSAPTRAWFGRLLIVTFGLSLAMNIIRPMISFRAVELGAGAFELGLIAASYSILSLVIALTLGASIDRSDPHVFLVGGAVLLGAAALVAAFVDSLPILAVAHTVMGVAQMAHVLAAQVWIADRSARVDWDSRFANLAVSTSVTQALGPVIAVSIASVPFLFDAEPFRAGRALAFSSVIAVAAAGLGAVLLAHPSVRVSRPSVSDVPAGSIRQTMGMARIPGIALAVVISGAVVLTVDLLIIYLPLWGLERGLSAPIIGLLLTSRAVGSIASRAILAAVTARFGWRMTLVGALLLTALALAGLSLSADAAFLLGVTFAIGFGLGAGQPMVTSWVASSVPAGQRGAMLGLQFAGNRLGQLMIPVVLGAIAAIAGVMTLFWILALTLAVVSVPLARVRLPWLSERPA
jgi:MFS family permease